MGSLLYFRCQVKNTGLTVAVTGALTVMHRCARSIGPVQSQRSRMFTLRQPAQKSDLPRCGQTGMGNLARTGIRQ